MSRPYQFPEENRVTSPLDRQPQNLHPSGQPPSFKTNVNRAKTKKWVEAKSYSYEGDDWGDYDEDDEYGVETTGSQPYTQQTPLAQGGRNFSTPTSGPSAHTHRRAPSYDAGDERRAFSAGAPQPAQPLHVETNLPGHATQGNTTASGNRQFSSTSFAPSVASDFSSVDPRHRSNYSPSAEPPPLHTGMTPGSGPSTVMPTAAPIPPRSDHSSTPPARPPSAGSTGSAARIIRPADIYKRVPEEREKERRSLEAQRGTPDSTAGRASMESVGATSPVGGEAGRTSMDSIGSGSRGHMRPTLASLPERKSEYGMPNTNVMAAPVQPGGASATPVSPNVHRAGTNPPQLPSVGGESTFGDDFWGSTPLAGASTAAPAPILTTTAPSDAHTGSAARAPEDESPGPLQHTASMGFNSIIHQAFDEPLKKRTDGVMKQDSTRSITDSSVSRSDTRSTSDISPIMSRASSSVAPGAKARAADAPPAIEEEPSDRPLSGEGFGAIHQIPRKPSPGSSHSRTGSAEFMPGYRRDLSTPNSNNSPARTPLVEANKQLPQPEVADLAMDSLDDVVAAKPLPQPLDPGGREADVTQATTEVPEKALPVLGASENAAQEASLERKPSLAVERSAAIKREESPSKGRVADLAGRFNNASPERRGSMDSWEAPSSRGSRSSSPVKGSPKETPLQRPVAEREVSFRPKLPGQWESFTTTLSEASQPEEKPAATTMSPVAEASPRTPTDVDLTPTSTKHTVPAKPVEESAERPSAVSDPMASVAAAGAAMGEAIKKSVGLGTSEESPQSPTRSFGEVPARPVAPDRMESTVSTIPPTPPEKDEENIPPPVPLKECSKSLEAFASAPPAVTNPPIMTQMSTEDSIDDFESDRIRKEIVRALNPSESTAPKDQHLAAGESSGTPAQRESSILPSEYESYWNDEKEVAPAETSMGLPEVVVGVSPENADGPSFLKKRFSWEQEDSGRFSLASPASGPESPVSPPNAASPAQGLDSAVEGTSHLTEKDLAEDNPRFSGEGLHVINAELGEIPQAPLRDAAPAPIEDHHPSAQPISPASPTRAAPTEGAPTQLGTDPRLPSFRDIVANKSPQQRIATYNSTRESWAAHDMGVNAWVENILVAHPEYRRLASEPMSAPTSTPGPRHQRGTSSISRVFTKPSPASHPGSNDPVYAGPAHDQSPGHKQRASSGQGKDFLQAASVLGGKGMKGAKGLFAKGKSKLRASGGHDKVDD